jgi:hypothetical protein
MTIFKCSGALASDVPDSDDDRPAAELTREVDAAIDDTPTISCSRCNREWDLSYELDELRLGNQAVEQFALDHMQHTGHFPDDVSTWQADCRRCPEQVERLSERGVRRWARTHARHTRHDVDIISPTEEHSALIEG